MAEKKKIGWIGMGRMGYPMAERLLKAGYDLSVWNRTRSKAEPLGKSGAKLADNLLELKDVDVLFSIVSTGKDLDQVYFGRNSVTGHGGKLPKIFVDCSTISVEESASIRDRLHQLGSEFVCAPVSGNAKVIKAGRLSAVVSGSEAACKTVAPILAEAVRRSGGIPLKPIMKRALHMFVIEGIYTSIPLQQRILADPDFQAGNFDTNFIKRFMPPAK